MKDMYQILFKDRKVIGELTRESLEHMQLFVEKFVELGKYKNQKLFVTIQFGASISRRESNKHIRNIFNIISSYMYGRHWNRNKENHLTGYCVSEKNKITSNFPQNYHYHLSIGEIKNRDEFKEEFILAFNQVIKSYYLSDIEKKPRLATCRDLFVIKDIDDEFGLRIYLTKTLRMDKINIDNFFPLVEGKIEMFH